MQPIHSIDLRSDTVTRPTPAMYTRMQEAEIGDDGLDGDPTAAALETYVARLLDKPAGVFVPSCTMANLLAVLAQGARNEQVVLEQTAHMFTSERGAATFTGMFYLGVPGQDGAMHLEELALAIKGGGQKLKTSLVAMETSHNNAGGTVLPLAHMHAVHSLAQAHGIRVHIDGARIFNAAAALQVEPSQIAMHADTVSVCLSKGLSAPVGAVLVGNAATIARARQLRKMLGGTQRQIGIMAAAGLEAVTHMRARLVEDHARARQLSELINAAHGNLQASQPQTNIVQVHVASTGKSNQQWVDMLGKAGVRVRPWGVDLLRCVTHRHITDADIIQAARVMTELAATCA